VPSAPVGRQREQLTFVCAHRRTVSWDGRKRRRGWFEARQRVARSAVRARRTCTTSRRREGGAPPARQSSGGESHACWCGLASGAVEGLCAAGRVCRANSS
jgi:hypothetical protein